MLDAAHILGVIEARLKELGLSQAQLGEMAFGTADTSIVQNLKRGSIPSAKRLSIIADVLDLDFRFGPKSVDQYPGFRETDRPRLITSDGTLIIAPLDQSSPEGPLAISRQLIDATGSRPENLRWTRQPHAGMTPLMAEGEIILVDQSRTDPEYSSGTVPRKAPPIFFVDLRSQRLAARVTRPDSTHYLLVFEERAYQPELCKVSQTRVIGAVVWWGNAARG